MSTLDFSALGPNSGFVKDQYELYAADPSLVSESWRRFFSSLNGSAQPSVRVELPLNGAAPSPGSDITIQLKVFSLTEAFRTWGHLAAKINPLSSVENLPKSSELSPSYHGITESDFSK